MDDMAACETHRECLSAEIDGELARADVAEARAALRAAHDHLDGCADCRTWLAAVTMLNRTVRLSPAEPGPGLSRAQTDLALAQLPRRRIRPGRRAARVALGAVGLAQTALGALALAGPADGAGMAAMHGTHGMRDVPDVAGLLHMSHEYAAWNLALGVAFVVGALWPRHLVGTLPVLAGFVGFLAVLSGIDLAHGDVDPTRVLSHALIVVTLVLIALIVAMDARRPWRWPFSTGGRPSARRTRSGTGAAPRSAGAASTLGAQARHRDAA